MLPRFLESLLYREIIDNAGNFKCFAKTSCLVAVNILEAVLVGFHLEIMFSNIFP